ncbi:MAG: aminotransferase class I/II-fold pyridoxal phosphate-dependent enzyme [bacterium]|nr:aminotransferase class I/II-fold pyridoxal phosphate-dependent enzyme [bacterium]
MKVIASKRVQSIGGYAFAEIDKKVAEAKARGVDVIDFGVGDPTDPTPKFIRNACKKGVDNRASSGYPSYIGSLEYRSAIATWVANRFGIVLDPKTEICSTIGAKEGVFHFPFGFVNPGDYVLCPTPGYPPYSRGTLFAGGIPWFYPLLERNNFFPDFKSIPEEIAKKSKILWLNYPNSPTGECATREIYEQAIEFAQRYNIIIASDECYSEIYFGEKPISILELAKEGAVVFQSFSKPYKMTGYRVGWAMGDSRIIDVFKKVKTNFDSGTPTFIQDAAIVAMEELTHVECAREEYRKRRDVIVEALVSVGLKRCQPEGTFYIWQKVPKGMTSVKFAEVLLEQCEIVVTPGEAISEIVADETNPGRDFVRFALVPSLERIKEAAERIRNLKF